MSELPRVQDLSEEKRRVWEELRVQVQVCRSKSGAESVAYEAGLEAQIRALQATDPDLCLAVDDNGWSLVHWAARRAKTEGLMRCVWECQHSCCGERALLAMRHPTPSGHTVLYCLACNPNMMRGMYAIFAEHCTNHDLCATDNLGWTLLCRITVTLVSSAKSEERQENVASVMCAVVRRLGPDALLAETTKQVDGYPAGSTPRSILHDAGDEGRALLQRLEEAAAHPEATEAEEKAETDSAPAERKESPPPARPTVDSCAFKALQRWIFRNTDIVDATDEWASALVRAGVVDEETLQTRFDADPSCLREIIPVASDRTQIEEALRTRPAPPTGRASSAGRSTPGAKPAEPSTDSVWDADLAAVIAEAAERDDEPVAECLYSDADNRRHELTDSDYIFQVFAVASDVTSAFVYRVRRTHPDIPEPTGKGGSVYYDTYYCLDHMLNKIPDDQFTVFAQEANNQDTARFRQCCKGLLNLRNKFFHDRGDVTFDECVVATRDFCTRIGDSNNAEDNLDALCDQHKYQFGLGDCARPEHPPAEMQWRRFDRESDAWVLETRTYPWERTPLDIARALLDVVARILMLVMDREGIDDRPKHGGEVARDVQKNLEHIRDKHAKRFADMIGWDKEELVQFLSSLWELRNRICHHTIAEAEAAATVALARLPGSCTMLAQCLCGRDETGALAAALAETKQLAELMERRTAAEQARSEAVLALEQHMLLLCRRLVEECSAKTIAAEAKLQAARDAFEESNQRAIQTFIGLCTLEEADDDDAAIDVAKKQHAEAGEQRDVCRAARNAAKAHKEQLWAEVTHEVAHASKIMTQLWPGWRSDVMTDDSRIADELAAMVMYLDPGHMTQQSGDVRFLRQQFPSDGDPRRIVFSTYVQGNHCPVLTLAVLADAARFGVYSNGFLARVLSMCGMLPPATASGGSAASASQLEQNQNHTQKKKKKKKPTTLTLEQVKACTSNDAAEELLLEHIPLTEDTEDALRAVGYKSPKLSLMKKLNERMTAAASDRAGDGEKEDKYTESVPRLGDDTKLVEDG